MKYIKLFEEFELGAGEKKDGRMPALLPVESEFITMDAIKDLGVNLKKVFIENGFKIFEPVDGALKPPTPRNTFWDTHAAETGKKEISISVTEHKSAEGGMDSSLHHYSVVKGVMGDGGYTPKKMPAHERIWLVFCEQDKDEVMSILKENSPNDVKIEEDKEQSVPKGVTTAYLYFEVK